MDTKISVIVPIYNSEKFLEECLESIARQSFREFECVMVNDGSTDNSGELCKKMARNDSRFRVFHKANGGVSAARNRGLEEARGEWVAFVDADDWLDVDYLKNFIESPFLRENTLLFQSWKICRQGRNEGEAISTTSHSFHEFETTEKTISGNRLLESWSPWGKLFNRQHIEREKLRFPETFSLGEDAVFLFRYLNNVNELKIVESAAYNYRISPVSLSKKITPWKIHYAGSVAISEEAIPVIRKFLRVENFYRKRLESLLLFEQHALRLETLYSDAECEPFAEKKHKRIQELRLAFGNRFALLKLLTPIYTRNRNYAVLWFLFILFPIRIMDWLLRFRFRAKCRK